MGLAPPPTRRHELGEFLRHHREATSPEAVGLPRHESRRTPGLRREKVSLLAGEGLSWYTWLNSHHSTFGTPSGALEGSPSTRPARAGACCERALGSVSSGVGTRCWMPRSAPS
jgi:hypothetical protein